MIFQLKNVSMEYGNQQLFADVSLNVPDNKKIGIVGVNGAGKTTLFKMLNGVITPSSGKILLKNDIKISLLPQVIKDEIPNMNITVFDYLESARPIKELEENLQKQYELLAISDNKEHDKIYKKIDKIQNSLNYYEYYNCDNILLQIIEGMDISVDLLDKKLNTLSGGQKSKIAFARILYSKPEVLLLDEPTNHLDQNTKDFIINYLKNYTGSVLIISHDIDFLNEITNMTMFLDKRLKTISLYEGNYERFKKLLDAKNMALKNEIEKQTNLENKLKSIVYQYTNSSGNRKKMAQDREKKLNKLLVNKIEVEPILKESKIDITMDHESSIIPVSVNNLSFRYDKKSNKKIINNISFSLNRGEKFLIVGENGVGKSTLLKLIIGTLKPDYGEITIDRKTDIGYYAQEHELLDSSLSIIDNFNDMDISQNELRSILGKFLFFGDDVFKKVSVLSPGERSRVSLVKLSLKKSNFLILDEPTNHLDPETQNIIADVFKSFKGTMLVVSHNPSFVNNLNIERMLTLPEGKISYYDEDIVSYYNKLNNRKN